MKILSVVGARPNLVKIAPILRAMRAQQTIESVLVHTGQHYDKKLSDIFFQQLKIAEPDFNLDVGSGSHSAQTAEILKRIEPVLLEQTPDLVLLVGDVNSTVAASLAAAKLCIPIAHVESGLRSLDRSMPEEINRVVTDALSDYLFVTEDDAITNLLSEGRPSNRIYAVGNVMIDALQQFLPLAQKTDILNELGLIEMGKIVPFGLLTLHRPANVDATDNLSELLTGIHAVADQIPIIFPVHPRTQLKLNALAKGDHPGLRMIAPLGYLEFLSLLSSAKLVLTDSGGIQEETTALGVPCLTLRENTERPVTISQGTNLLVGTDPAKILAAATAILAGKAKSGTIPRLWDGHAAERIVDILIREIPDSKSK
jgi:UDP-N-acetylglucosamine 2-epimerase (non-hydrolysing)